MKKIVIVEDEEILRNLLYKKLSAEGYNVVAAVNGEEGLQKIREEKPDLVLLDIVMPKMDGFEMLEKLRKDEEIKETLVVIISNSGQPVEIDKAQKFGVKDWLVKTEFDPQEVLDKVEAQIGPGEKGDNSEYGDSEEIDKEIDEIAKEEEDDFGEEIEEEKAVEEEMGNTETEEQDTATPEIEEEEKKEDPLANPIDEEEKKEEEGDGEVQEEKAVEEEMENTETEEQDTATFEIGEEKKEDPLADPIDEEEKKEEEDGGEVQEEKL